MLSLDQQVYKSGRLLGHISYDFIDPIGEEVVAELDDDTDNQSSCGCDERLRDTAGYHRGLDVASRLNRLKRVDHAAHRSEETDHGRQVGHCHEVQKHLQLTICHIEILHP